MLDSRGVVFSRMDLIYLGFQGGGEWRCSELRHSVSRHPRALMVHDPCPRRRARRCGMLPERMFMGGRKQGTSTCRTRFHGGYRCRSPGGSAVPGCTTQPGVVSTISISGECQTPRRISPTATRPRTAWRASPPIREPSDVVIEYQFGGISFARRFQGAEWVAVVQSSPRYLHDDAIAVIIRRQDLVHRDLVSHLE